MYANDVMLVEMQYHKSNCQAAYQTGRQHRLLNSYTMVCLPVCGDNPRALASGLSRVQMDNHGITVLYHLHRCRPFTLREVSCKSWLGCEKDIFDNCNRHFRTDITRSSQF